MEDLQRRMACRATLMPLVPCVSAQPSVKSCTSPPSIPARSKAVGAYGMSGQNRPLRRIEGAAVSLADCGTGGDNNNGVSHGYAFSRPHQSAMNRAVAWVTRRTEARSTRSLKPWIDSARGPYTSAGVFA